VKIRKIRVNPRPMPDDVLADADIFEDFLLDALGKENDSLLVTRGAGRADPYY